MGRVIVHDGDLHRHFTTEEFDGTVEVDLTTEDPEVVVPVDVAVRERGRVRSRD